MRFFSALFSLDKIPSENFDLRRQARSLQILVAALAVATFLATVTQLVLTFLSEVVGGINVPASPLPTPILLAAETTNIISTFTCWWLIGSNRIQFAVHFFFGSILVAVLFFLFLEPDFFPFMVILAFLPMIGATLLRGIRASLFYAAGALIVPALHLVLAGQSIIGHIIASIALILTVWLFGESLSQALRKTNALTKDVQDLANNLQQQVDSQTATLRHRTEQLALSVELGQAASRATDINQLLQSVIEIIHKKATYYHVGIFLWDAGSSSLTLCQVSTPLQTILHNQSIQFTKDEQSLVGWVATYGQGRFLNDAPSHALYRPHPLLPQTRSELALPLQIRGNLIGVLDVHSQDFNFFQEEDLAIWQLATDQIANYLDHARLLTESQRQASLLKQLPTISSLMFQQANIRNALNVLAQRVMSLLQTDGATVWLWREQSQKLELVIHYIHGQLSPNKTNLQVGQELLNKLFQENRTLVIDEAATWSGRTNFEAVLGLEFQSAVAVPLQQGNQPFGILAFIRNLPHNPFTPEEVQFLESLALQAGSIIYNDELVEETRRLAQREQKVNQITEAIRRNLDLKTILETTADELGSALGGSLVRVRLNAPAELKQEN